MIRAGGTLQAAFALLTRLPVHPGDEMASGAAAFPIVGVLVGAVGAVPILLGGGVEPVVASLLAIAAMTVLTGALHLDGLADTADALLAPDPTTAERARKDPSVGPGGAVALILVLGIEVAALAGIAGSAGAPIAAAALVMAAVVGRTLPVVVVVLAGDRAERGGFGGWFAARVGPVDAVVAVVLAVLVTAAPRTGHRIARGRDRWPDRGRGRAGHRRCHRQRPAPARRRRDGRDHRAHGGRVPRGRGVRVVGDRHERRATWLSR